MPAISALPWSSPPPLCYFELVVVMKTENIVLFAIAAFGLWYLMRGETAQAAPPIASRLPGIITTGDIQASLDTLAAERAARARTDAMRTAFGLPTHGGLW